MTSDTYAHEAHWYDLIYAAQGKDYPAEALRVVELVRERSPHARTLLDVGCGTGRHLLALAEHFDHVSGVDLTPHFVQHARELGLDARVGNMLDLHVDEPVDVVTCLFSAVAHARNEDELDTAVSSMARCLAPGGVLVLEPWFSPAQWSPGWHGVEVADGEGEILVRTNHSGIDGTHSVVDFAWTHVDEHGITRMDERLHLLLAPPDRYRIALERAGLVDLRYHADGLGADGRGLWVASTR